MNKALSSLGLAMKAGRVQCGQSVCDKLIKSGDARLILIDDGASAGTKKAVTDACAFYKVSYRFIPSGELGAAIGKPGRMVAAITDSALAERISVLLEAASTTID